VIVAASLAEIAARVALRWAARREIPVKNKDTGRIVYVLPETLEKRPGDFQTNPRRDELSNPLLKGKPSKPARPKKPHKPEIPRDAPPAPARPPIPIKRIKPIPPVKPVPELKVPKVPIPPPFRKWKKLKHLQAQEVVVRVASRARAGVTR
jgi:hypothetical protein